MSMEYLFNQVLIILLLLIRIIIKVSILTDVRNNCFIFTRFFIEFRLQLLIVSSEISKTLIVLINIFIFIFYKFRLLTTLFSISHDIKNYKVINSEEVKKQMSSIIPTLINLLLLYLTNFN